jgi:hypothetical protein
MGCGDRDVAAVAVIAGAEALPSAGSRGKPDPSPEDRMCEVQHLPGCGLGQHYEIVSLQNAANQ